MRISAPLNPRGIVAFDTAAATATRAVISANATGAACTAFMLSVLARPVAASVAPRAESRARSRSMARQRRCRAASSLTPSTSPTSPMLRPSKYRSAMARRSFSPSDMSAPSSNGRTSAHVLSSDGASVRWWFMSAARCSCLRRRRSRRRASRAVSRAARSSHADSTMSRSINDGALRARVMKTCWVTSSASVRSCTCRMAAE